MCSLFRKGSLFAAKTFSDRSGPTFLSAPVILLLVVAGCRREERDPYFRPALSIAPDMTNPSEERAYDVSEGKQMYRWFNCNGCHSDGGGNIGPPLMDGKWIYGGSPYDVYTSIMDGRPNGMPSFRRRLTEKQGWQLVAYVRSMSGQLRADVAPGRDDHMYFHVGEQRTEDQGSVSAPDPKSP